MKVKLFCIVLITTLIILCSPLKAYSRDYKASEVDIKKISGTWVSVKKGTNTKVKYTGVAKNKHGWWRVKDGKVDFSANGIYKNENGWWKTTGGKVTFDETGVFKNDYGWWRTIRSKVDFNAYGVYKNKYGWWYVEGGKVNFKYTGLASNEYGTWMISKGKADFDFSGVYTHNDVRYSIQGGKVSKTATQHNTNILFYGDSLASGWKIEMEAVNAIDRSYPNVASMYLGVSLNNLSTAGQMYSDYTDGRRGLARYRIHDVDLTKYDVIVIAVGINDFFKNIPIGSARSTSTSNFRGSVNQTYKAIERASKLRKSYGKPPTKLLIYQIGYYFNDFTNSSRHKIKDYNDAILASATENLYTTRYQIVKNNVIVKSTYLDYTSDKLHYNPKGVNVSAIELIEYLSRYNMLS